MKKRGFAILATIAFALSIVEMATEKETAFWQLLVVLYALLAVSLLVFKGTKLSGIFLLLLTVMSFICVIPYSYKLLYSMGLIPEYWENPSWWDAGYIEAHLMSYISGGGMSVELVKCLLGIGSMTWLHIDCISALLGIVALLLMTKSAFSKGKKKAKTSLNLLIMILLICSRFTPWTCVAYYLTYCAVAQEV